ncbi:hypothetical protein WDU94_002367 [Cyamophila willieti]
MRAMINTRVILSLQDMELGPWHREATLQMAPQAMTLLNPRTEMQELTVSLENLQGHAIKIKVSCKEKKISLIYVKTHSPYKLLFSCKKIPYSIDNSLLFSLL